MPAPPGSRTGRPDESPGKNQNRKIEPAARLQSRYAAIVDRKTLMELKAIVSTICEKYPGSILKETDHNDIHEITVAAQSFYEVMKTLHGDVEFGFDMLTDVVGIDRTPRT